MSESQVSERSGWPVVAAGFVCLTVAAGIGFYVFPVFLGSVQEEFGWSLTSISGAVTLWGIVGAIFSPLCGRWIDSFGARKVMVFGVMCQFTATILLGSISSLWHLYALMALSSVGNICNTYIPVAAVIAKWFDKRRGTATGVAMLGLGAGGFTMPLLAGRLLESYSWRTGYFMLSFLVLGLLVPIILWIREPVGVRSAKVRVPERDDDAGQGEKTVVADLTLRQALRTRSFWAISVGDAITGLVFAIFTVHLVYFLTESGVAQGAATTVFAILLLCLSLGTAVFGLSADKVSLRGLMVFAYGLPALTTLLLLPSGIAVLPFLFAVLCGTCGGGRTALFPLALVRCFGASHMGAIYGLSNSFFLVGNALGPLIAGYLYDTTGSARPVYALACVLFVVSAVLISLMRREYGTAGPCTPGGTPNESSVPAMD